jgi:hypothetical protein
MYRKETCAVTKAVISRKIAPVRLLKKYRRKSEREYTNIKR